MSAEPAIAPSAVVPNAHAAWAGDRAQDANLERAAPPKNLLEYLIPGDFELLSSVAGRSVSEQSVILPLLAAQIGSDRRSSALPMSEQLSISYFKSLLGHHRDIGALTVSLVREIDLAMAYLYATREKPAERPMPTPAFVPSIVGRYR